MPKGCIFAKERLSLDDLKVNATIVAWLAYCAAMDDNRIPIKRSYPEAAIK